MILQLIIGGTATGAIYALMAMGFSLLWQTSQTINFAQGEFVAAAAFIMLIFYDALNLPYLISLVLTIIVAVGILGVIRNIIALALQLFDRCSQLRDRSADVWQFYDVCFGCFSQVSQLSQRIADLLLPAQLIGKISDDTSGQ